MKKLFTLLLALLMLLCSLSACKEYGDDYKRVSPSPEPSTEAPTTADGTKAIERDFSDNKLWLLIKEEYHDHVYTSDDFPELDCFVTNDLPLGATMDPIECPSYTVSFLEKDKDNVLKACELLMRRPEVEKAVPEYYPEGYTGTSDFIAYEVAIVVKKEYHNRVYTLDDFPEFDFRYIEHSLALFFSETPYEEILDQPIYTAILPIHSKEAVLETCRRLMEREDIEFAQESHYGEFYSVPNDPSYSSQWGLGKIAMPSAWDFTTGSSSVVVGVIDSGIKNTHPDLSTRIDSSKSASFITGVGPFVDTVGHGTRVAGIIGACGNNGRGISGVCWNVKIASLKVSKDGEISSAAVANALDHAKSKGIKIVNISFGVEPHPTLKCAIDRYTNWGGLIVCAAGNHGKNLDDDDLNIYPASLPNSRIIVVGASTQADQKWTKSGYSKTRVDLFAPGANIYSTTASGSYGSDSGTSFAAPHVTGVAALLLSLHPTASADKIKAAIMNGVDRVSAFNNLCVSGGRLNAYKALSYAGFHNLTQHVSLTSSHHKSTCSVCHISVNEPHDFAGGGGVYTCRKCGHGVGAQQIEDVDE